MTPITSLDDLVIGAAYDLGTFALTEPEIIEFARRFDPQPFHLDSVAARDSLFGGLVAAGLHTLSAVMGQIMGSGLLTEVSLGGNEMHVRWPAPLRPDETVAVRIEVVEIKPSRSRRTLGVVRLRYLATRVADGVIVLDAVGTHFLRR